MKNSVEDMLGHWLAFPPSESHMMSAPTSFASEMQEARFYCGVPFEGEQPALLLVYTVNEVDNVPKGHLAMVFHEKKLPSDISAEWMETMLVNAAEIIKPRDDMKVLGVALPAMDAAGQPVPPTNTVYMVELPSRDLPRL